MPSIPFDALTGAEIGTLALVAFFAGAAVSVIARAQFVTVICAVGAAALIAVVIGISG